MKKIIILFAILVLLTSCGESDRTWTKNITFLKLGGDLAERSIEASGLSWYKDNLIILPQFPHKWDSENDGAIYFVTKERIEKYIDGSDQIPIYGEKIKFIATGLDSIGKSRGSGYEAITFKKDTVFVSIESVNNNNATSYLVKGIINFEERKIILDSESTFEVKSQTGIYNMGEETILEFGGFIYSIHEANGEKVNQSPTVTKLDSDLREVQKINFPNIDYRITDATSVDSTGKFYAINYFYPGEFKKLRPILSEELKDYAIEKILEFQIMDDKIIETDKDPILISDGVSKDGNNWEGIVRLNDGFLIITDMFPMTKLIYLKN